MYQHSDDKAQGWMAGPKIEVEVGSERYSIFSNIEICKIVDMLK